MSPKPHELLITAAQLAVAAVIAWQLLGGGREDVPAQAVAWRAVASGAGKVATVAGRLAIDAEARYWQAVRS